MNNDLDKFYKGRPVRISAVAFPNIPHHAEDIGKRGTVLKTVKCHHQVVVLKEDGKKRWCDVNNVEILA